MACSQSQTTTTNNCNNSGIVEILQNILQAQMIAEVIEEEDEFCDRKKLGPCSKKKECNTRPINLYTCDGTPLKIDFTENSEENTTRVFRIEKIDGCVCTFRCLRENPNKSCKEKFVKTDTFFSVDYSCCCHILKCLKDTYVDCI